MEKMICRQGMADTPKAWIYYKESGHGVPILMLHGNAETHRIFDVCKLPGDPDGQPCPRTVPDQARQCRC